VQHVRLLTQKHYPAGWVTGWAKGLPELQEGAIVPVIPATNQPTGEGHIRYWIATPALIDDPYGVGLYDGEYELLPRGD